MVTYSFGLKALTAAFAALSVTTLPTPAAAQPLQPSTPWNVDYAENECRLVRNFGTGEDKVWLRIARGASFDTYDMMIGSPSLPRSTKAREMNITALPTNASIAVNAVPYSAQFDGKLNYIYRWYDVDEAFLDGLGNDQEIGLKAGTDINVQLKPSGMKKALAVLKTCHDNLLSTVFKVDLAAVRALKSLPKPIGNVASWITTDDYPSAALVRKWQGHTQFVLNVGTDGTVSDCLILVSSGHEILDREACALMKRRGKFTPGMNANGQPVTAPWLQGVRWQIPG